jgi:ABC-2 type transport system permease protein
MFQSLLWFEIKNRLNRWSAIVYFSLFFMISFFLAIAFGGAFNSGFSNELALNSPVVIHYLVCSVGYLGLLIIAPIFGQSVNQDFQTGFHQILFTTPIRQLTYFIIRYLGSFLSVMAIFFSIGLGILVATFMPFIDRTMLIENHFWFYVAPYFSILIPNTLVFGAIFIAIASTFKNMNSVYIASIAIFTGWMIGGSLIESLDNQLIASLIEPFGIGSARQVIRYWSVDEQSSQVIPLTGYFLYNRFFWGIIGFTSLAVAYLTFNPRSRLLKGKENVPFLNHLSEPLKLLLPEIKLSHRSWKVFWEISISEFRQAFSNMYFLIIIFCGVLYIFIVGGHAGKLFETETFPVTYHVLEVIGGVFSLFVVIITTYYAGELVWRDKELRVYQIVDSQPISNSFLYLSKLISLFLIQIFLLAIILISSVLIQMLKGYYLFEWSVYARALLFYTLPSWLLTSVLALFIQTLSPNKYIAHLGVVLSFLFLSILPLLGFEHCLCLVGVLPRAVYSDMNGFGSIFESYLTLTIYWGFFHLCLATLTVLFSQRGVVSPWKKRLIEFKSRIKPIHKILFFGSLCIWIATGCFIYYNTNILNEYVAKSEQEYKSVDYENIYKSFEKAAQPNLVAVNLEVDLFPESQSMKGKGLFKYRNTSTQPIKTVLLNLSKRSEVDYLTWNQSAILVKDDQRLGVKIYDFEDLIQPGEEIQLQFGIRVIRKGFKNSQFSKDLVENGTFISGSDFFPALGYSLDREISEDVSRRKYGLPQRPRMHDINDSVALQKTYISNEGNWIEFEAIISTLKDQTAIAPGYLQKEWEENDRRYFHYKMDQLTLPIYAFLSARYEVVRDHWNDVAIEVYHHPGHTYNIPRMIRSVKKSLDYYTHNFSPYQFKQLRIVEFPRYGTFAVSLPNTIPYSEGIGFIAKVNLNDPECIDYPFYVTAHEVAHQWWAHQVVGGNVQGATMLSESLAQYSAFMVMEKEYGPEQMRKFLKLEMDKYLIGRTRESKELPLMLNENQQYIHYQKGGLVFYALKDYLGEDLVNQVLQKYIHDFAFQEPPFTRSVDLVKRFKEVTPEDKKYLIEDLFETITFYDNHTDAVSFKKTGNCKYEVEICSTNKKLRADELGREYEVPMDDYLDIGIFDEDGHLEYLQKHKVKNGINQFRIEVERQPSKAGIDPLNKLINKNRDMNVMKAVETL